MISQLIDFVPVLLAQSSDTPPMVEKLPFLVPEIILFTATVLVMVLGLSPNRAWRRSCAGISIIALIAAGIVALWTPAPIASALPGLMLYAKPLIASVGVLLILLLTGTVDRAYEHAVAKGHAWDALRSTRGEFYAFALFSLTGLMLCTTADDLIWLFLALELTSLPTYVMVTISTSQTRSQEAGIKYFFLGAIGAATFLFGFALLYGATGTTMLWGEGSEPGVAQILAEQVRLTGSIGSLATAGMILALVGVSFKIAAVPMHFYTPDVYEGAATSVSAFLAFVPKAAGFISMILLLSVVGWGFGSQTPEALGSVGSLPEEIRVTLWVVAALTMTVGNVLALLQSNVKRILAYSSIAHSGYMLVGLIAGPGDGRSVASNGIAATLFYLLCYGFMNLGAFAVLASLERRNGEEIETVDDLRGMCATHRGLGWTMVLCSLSMLGLPPLLGFFGKLMLFASAIHAHEIALVVVMGLNSAIAAYYYLRLAGMPVLEAPSATEQGFVPTPARGRVVAGMISAASVVALVPLAGWLMNQSESGGRYEAQSLPANPELTRATSDPE